MLHITFVVATFLPLDKGKSQLNLKRSVLMKVVRVLESPKVQEMEFAQQVRDMLTETSLPRPGNEDLQITHRPSMTRYFLFNHRQNFGGVHCCVCVDLQKISGATRRYRVSFLLPSLHVVTLLSVHGPFLHLSLQNTHMLSRYTMKPLNKKWGQHFIPSREAFSSRGSHIS